MDGSQDFAWSIPVQGCEWIKGRAREQGGEAGRFPWEFRASDLLNIVARESKRKPQHFLVENRAGPAEQPRNYHPFRDTRTLFRDFAETTATLEGIRAFANTYGDLGGNAVCRFWSSNTKSGSTTGRPDFGSPLFVWKWEILSLRHAVAIWDLVSNGNRARLKSLVHWAEDGRAWIRYPNPDDHLPVYIDNFPSGWDGEPMRFVPFYRHRGGRRKDPVEPAVGLVRATIEEHLRGRVWASLGRRDQNRPKLALQFVPNSLIGAMWLQFARSVDGNHAYRRCDQCSIWFELSRDAARRDKRYCSDACRMRAYRRRKIS